MSQRGIENREVLIQHLKAELEELRNSSLKYEELNHALINLENNYKILRDEKDKSEKEGQLKLIGIQESILEAEAELKELREDIHDADNATNESKSQFQNLKAELDFFEQKESSINSKLDELNRIIEGIVQNKESLSMDIDLKRKENIDINANLSSMESEIGSMEDRISKLRQAKDSQQSVMIDLDTEEARLLAIRNEKMAKREKLANGLSSRENENINLAQTLTELEERNQIVNAEIHKMKVQMKEVEIKRLEEEKNRDNISTKINTKESELRQIGDMIMNETLEKEKEVNNLNEIRQMNERELNKTEDLSRALKSLIETHTKLSCSLEQMKLESLELVNTLTNSSQKIENVKSGLEAMNNSALSALSRNLGR